ncbi:MAG: type II toxin-antitoxin system RelE/ParE family toxin [Roseiarcus sp.]
MIEVRQTAVFSAWLAALRDQKAVARIDVRIRRLSLGNPGDAKTVGEGVRELRIDYGPGYRVYFVQRRQVATVLLCGGDKGSQEADIVRAKKLAKEV